MPRQPSVKVGFLRAPRAHSGEGRDFALDRSLDEPEPSGDCLTYSPGKKNKPVQASEHEDYPRCRIIFIVSSYGKTSKTRALVRMVYDSCMTFYQLLKICGKFLLICLDSHSIKRAIGAPSIEIEIQ